jgi:hypothetical protein
VNDFLQKFLMYTLLFFSERMEKISDIRKNIQQSIVVLLTAMSKMEIPLAQQENEESRQIILNQAGDPQSHRTNVSSK